MNKYTHVLTLLLCSAILFWSCAKETVDPNFTGSIEGQVKNSETGQPVAEVSITTNPGTDAILTDENGQFALNDISTGNYTVQAQKDSFVTKSIRISVEEDRVTNAQIILKPNNEEGSSNGNLNAMVTFFGNVTYSNTSTADSNFVDVEYMVENISSTDRLGNYEVYFKIFTAGTIFNQEIQGDSLATNEQTFGTFTKYIRETTADSVVVSGIYTSN